MRPSSRRIGPAQHLRPGACILERAPVERPINQFDVFIPLSAGRFSDRHETCGIASYMIDQGLSKGELRRRCTIYDTHYPEPQGRRVNAALALFNDAITRLAFARGVGLIDLRLVCTEPADFANPIEPSEQGGDKITAAIASFVAAGAEERGRSAMWI